MGRCFVILIVVAGLVVLLADIRPGISKSNFLEHSLLVTRAEVEEVAEAKVLADLDDCLSVVADSWSGRIGLVEDVADAVADLIEVLVGAPLFQGFVSVPTDDVLRCGPLSFGLL